MCATNNIRVLHIKRLRMKLNNILPLVSIVTPAYNRASYLDEAIQSVLGQDYPHIEYIISDDSSTDNTREVLQKYAGRVIWETYPNIYG